MVRGDVGALKVTVGAVRIAQVIRRPHVDVEDLL